TIPLVVLGIVASAIVLLASGVIFFSLAFWLGRVETAARQVFESLVTFALYPEPLFGGALRLVVFCFLSAGGGGLLPGEARARAVVRHGVRVVRRRGPLWSAGDLGLRSRPAVVRVR